MPLYEDLYLPSLSICDTWNALCLPNSTPILPEPNFMKPSDYHDFVVTPPPDQERRSRRLARALDDTLAHNTNEELPLLHQKFTRLPYKVMPIISPLLTPTDDSFVPPTSSTSKANTQTALARCSYSEQEIFEADSFISMNWMKREDRIKKHIHNVHTNDHEIHSQYVRLQFIHPPCTHTERDR